MDWKKVVEDAQAEIETLEIRREDIEKRIQHLKRTIVAAEPLAMLTGTGANEFLVGLEAEGITDACRQVLRASGKWMTPLAVRSALEANGLDLSKQANAMASIHTVLKRLKAKGEVKVARDSDGGTVYRWRASLFRRRLSAPPPDLEMPPSRAPVDMTAVLGKSPDKK